MSNLDTVGNKQKQSKRRDKQRTDRRGRKTDLPKTGAWAATAQATLCPESQQWGPVPHRKTESSTAPASDC